MISDWRCNQTSPLDLSLIEVIIDKSVCPSPKGEGIFLVAVLRMGAEVLSQCLVDGTVLAPPRSGRRGRGKITP